MRHRTLTTPPPPEADLDTPETTDASLAAEQGDEDVRVLAEIVEIRMRLMRAHEACATARMATLAATGAAADPGETPTAAYDKLALTARTARRWPGSARPWAWSPTPASSATACGSSAAP